jgi:hypothetical protein
MANVLRFSELIMSMRNVNIVREGTSVSAHQTTFLAHFDASTAVAARSGKRTGD